MFYSFITIYTCHITTISVQLLLITPLVLLFWLCLPPCDICICIYILIAWSGEINTFYFTFLFPSFIILSLRLFLQICSFDNPLSAPPPQEGIGGIFFGGTAVIFQIQTNLRYIVYLRVHSMPSGINF